MTKHYHLAIDGTEITPEEYAVIAKRNIEIFNMPLDDFKAHVHELRFICVTETEN